MQVIQVMSCFSCFLSYTNRRKDANPTYLLEYRGRKYVKFVVRLAPDGLNTGIHNVRTRRLNRSHIAVFMRLQHCTPTIYTL